MRSVSFNGLLLFIPVLFSRLLWVHCEDTSCFLNNGTRLIGDTFSCCDGFIRDEGSASFRCSPVCSSPCVNGDCTSPDECTCRDGYTRHSTDRHVCIPLCNTPCRKGFICLHPDVCCPPGHEYTNGTCSPICSDCVNGRCTKPYECTCNTGYYLSDITGICEPHCVDECHHGKCIEPNVCDCEAGWVMLANRTCGPICDPHCVSGHCVAPNTCQCWIGFISINDSCLAIESTAKPDYVTTNKSDVEVSTTVVSTEPVPTRDRYIYVNHDDKDTRWCEHYLYWILVCVVLVVCLLTLRLLLACWTHWRNAKYPAFSKGRSYRIADVESKANGPRHKRNTLNNQGFSESDSKV